VNNAAMSNEELQERIDRSMRCVKISKAGGLSQEDAEWWEKEAATLIELQDRRIGDPQQARRDAAAQGLVDIVERLLTQEPIAFADVQIALGTYKGECV